VAWPSVVVQSRRCPEGMLLRECMVRRYDLMQDALLVADEKVFEVDGGAGDDGRRLIEERRRS